MCFLPLWGPMSSQHGNAGGGDNSFSPPGRQFELPWPWASLFKLHAVCAEFTWVGVFFVRVPFLGWFKGKIGEANRNIH